MEKTMKRLLEFSTITVDQNKYSNKSLCSWLRSYSANEPSRVDDADMASRPSGRGGRNAAAPRRNQANQASQANQGNQVISLSKEEMAAFETECLKVHNKYRTMHGCPMLKLKRKLSDLATDWAQTLAKRNNMEHRPNNDDYGENIYYSEGMPVDAEAAVKMWYDEITLYNFEAGKFKLEAGHFTQLIWRDTKELGVGVALRGDKVWVVANYEPPGNWQGEFRENVPRKKT